MDITITLPEFFVVSKTSKDKVSKETLFEFERHVRAEDVAAMEPHILAKYFEYGFGQKMADCMASCKTLEEAEAAFEKMWDSLSEGVWRTGGGGKAYDAVTKLARTMCESAVKKAYEKAGGKWADRDTKAVSAEITRRVAEEPKWRAAAEVALEAVED